MTSSERTISIQIRKLLEYENLEWVASEIEKMVDQVESDTARRIMGMAEEEKFSENSDTDIALDRLRERIANEYQIK